MSVTDEFGTNHECTCGASPCLVLAAEGDAERARLQTQIDKAAAILRPMIADGIADGWSLTTYRYIIQDALMHLGGFDPNPKGFDITAPPPAGE